MLITNYYSCKNIQTYYDKERSQYICHLIIDNKKKCFIIRRKHYDFIYELLEKIFYENLDHVNIDYEKPYDTTSEYEESNFNVPVSLIE